MVEWWGIVAICSSDNVIRCWKCIIVGRNIMDLNDCRFSFLFFFLFSYFFYSERIPINYSKRTFVFRERDILPSLLRRFYTRVYYLPLKLRHNVFNFKADHFNSRGANYWQRSREVLSRGTEIKLGREFSFYGSYCMAYIFYVRSLLFSY